MVEPRVKGIRLLLFLPMIFLFCPSCISFHSHSLYIIRFLCQLLFFFSSSSFSTSISPLLLPFPSSPSPLFLSLAQFSNSSLPHLYFFLFLLSYLLPCHCFLAHLILTHSHLTLTSTSPSTHLSIHPLLSHPSTQPLNSTPLIPPVPTFIQSPNHPPKSSPPFSTHPPYIKMRVKC